MADKKLSKAPILGHEASGIVEKVGSKVTKLKPGDRIAVEPNNYCGKCTFCIHGKNNLCYAEPNVEIPPRDGLFQQFYTTRASLIHKIPDDMPLEVAAFTEPLACVLHGVIRSRVKAGEDVLITGAGPVGLLSALAAKAYGATNIVITDINPLRLEIAKKIGIENTLLIDPKDDPVAAVPDVVKILGNEPDVTLECTGFESALRLAIAVTVLGGRIGLIGLGASQVNVPLSTAAIKELELIGSSKYGNTFALSLKLLASKQIDPRGIISHKLNLDNLPQAFDLLSKGQGSKVLIEF